MHFFAKIFGGLKKKQYLCTRFRKKGIKLTRSKRGFSGNRPYCKAGNIPEAFWKGAPENSRLDELLISVVFFTPLSIRDTLKD